MQRVRYRQTLSLALTLCALAGGLCAEEKPVLLLTGFEPFGGAKINPSWETVKTFEGKEIGGYRIVTALLPVVYDEMAAPLKKAIETNKPEIVICFGVGSKVIQVELVAKNGYHPQKPPDNKGLPPPREKIDPDGKNAFPTKLPADEILAALKEKNIGAGKSTNAGGYLCNECFYRLMESDVPAHPFRACGFVHVPEFETKDPAGGTFTPEKLKQAVETIVTATVHAQAPQTPAAQK